MIDLGVDNYNRGLQVYQRLRSRGVQMRKLSGMAPHGTSTKMGTWTYNRVMSPGQRLVSRGKTLRTFGIGGDNKPWYEAFFQHMENIAPIASTFVLQIMDKRYDQQRYAWQQASQDQRESAYFDMFKSMVAQKQGTQGTVDPQTQRFLMQQFQQAPRYEQQSAINQASGGNEQVADALWSLVIPWYKKPIVWVGLGGAAIGGIAIIIAITK